MEILHIGKRIKKMRELNNLERRKINAFSSSHLGNIENGHYNGSEDSLVNLSKELNLPRNYLTRWQDFDTELNDQLATLKDEIEEDLEKAKKSIAFIKENYPYINSLYHEIFFFLLETYYLLKSGDYHQALNYYQREVEPLIEVDKLSNSMIETYYYIQGTFKFYQKSYNESLKHYYLHIPLASNNKTKAATYYNIALCLSKIRNYEKAIYYSEKALSIHLAERSFDKAAEADNLLGSMYWRLKDLDKAKVHLKKSLALAEQYQLKRTMASNYHNIGLVNKDEENYAESLKYFQDSLSLKSDSESTILTYRSIIELYLEQNQLDKVEETLFQLNELNPSALDNNHLRILEAKLYLKQGDENGFIKNMNAGIKYYLDNDHTTHLDDILEDYANYNYSKKKYKPAAKYYKLAIETKYKLGR